MKDDTTTRQKPKELKAYEVTRSCAKPKKIAPPENISTHCARQEQGGG